MAWCLTNVMLFTGSDESMVSSGRQTTISCERYRRRMTTAPARQRIIDAALALVVEGGYEALQVRAITERAAVSSRTIYTFFPSLDSLLIIAIAERAGAEVYGRLTQGSRKRTAAGRVEEVIDDLVRIMTDNRALTVGLLRALLSGKPDVAQHVRGFAATTQAVLATAIRPDGPSAADRETAEILEAIYFCALIGWATGADTEEHLRRLMHRAITRTLRNQ